MEKLFERHDAAISNVSMEYVRDIMQRIHWNSRLIAIRGPKGVGKSTLMKQYIKSHFEPRYIRSNFIFKIFNFIFFKF